MDTNNTDPVRGLRRLAESWLFDDGYLTGIPDIDERTNNRASAKRECAEALLEFAETLSTALAYADADALIAHLDGLCDESDEKWQPAQAAIAGILSWQTTGSPVAAPQQPAAVDDAMVERFKVSFANHSTADTYQDRLRIALTAALAAQQQG